MPPFFVSIPGALATLGVLVLVIHGALNGRAAVSRPAALSRPSGRPTMQVVISLAVLATALYTSRARRRPTTTSGLRHHGRGRGALAATIWH